MYNIATNTGRIMLGCNVHTREDAEKYLLHYTKDVGKPYPNGKGVYPDCGYRIIDVTDIKVSLMYETYLDAAELRRRSIV